MEFFNQEAAVVKAARKRTKLSQTEVSKKLGYKNGQFISNVERGLCGVPLKTMKKTCEVLGIKETELQTAKANDFNERLAYYLENGDSDGK